MNLSDEDVRDILELVDSLPYDELRVRTAGFSLTLRRTADGTWTQETEVLSPPRVVGGPTGPEAAADVPASTGTPPAPASADGARSRDTAKAVDGRALRAVRTPLLGTFYRAPRPGAPPFVEVGDQVDDSTVVGIVETMKLMNPVHAGVSGTVFEVCLADAQFAEQDTVLMRVAAP